MPGVEPDGDLIHDLFNREPLLTHDEPPRGQGDLPTGRTGRMDDCARAISVGARY
jgi:hypothetical protein